jgi:succinate dehydrogenase/fumarate reductase-like Fe-S protein
MSETAMLKIWRGRSKAEGRWEVHAVPFEHGQSVLDGLRWIRSHRDPSLAIRFSCINANACKECMMELDGETVYACTARLEPREMALAPLSNKTLVRDLVSEIAPPAERFVAPPSPAPRAGQAGKQSSPGGGNPSK